MSDTIEKRLRVLANPDYEGDDDLSWLEETQETMQEAAAELERLREQLEGAAARDRVTRDTLRHLGKECDRLRAELADLREDNPMSPARVFQRECERLRAENEANEIRAKAAQVSAKYWAGEVDKLRAENERLARDAEMHKAAAVGGASMSAGLDDKVLSLEATVASQAERIREVRASLYSEAGVHDETCPLARLYKPGG